LLEIVSLSVVSSSIINILICYTPLLRTKLKFILNYTIKSSHDGKYIGFLKKMMEIDSQETAKVFDE